MSVVTIPLSVYLHVPFCRVKCTYCAFNTYVNLDALVEPFVQALIREIEIVGHSQPNAPVWTIFFGGGTPSMLTPAQFERILAALHAAFRVLPDAEVTLEANPGDLDRPYLADLRAVGLNRISIGMQTANANELQLFNRRHDNDAVARAVAAARAGGFTNLNLDLIYGFPHQTRSDWEMTLRSALALRPEHFSLYALGLEEGTPMHQWVMTGRLPLPDEDLAADMYELATDTLAAAGYDQYEISNWSLPNHECRHNLQYWRNWPYVGLGPGAHGFAGNVRYSTVLSPQRYIKQLLETEGAYPFPHTPATAEATPMTRDQEIAETLIMGLRLLHEGIEREAFRARFGADLLALHPDVLRRFQSYGLLHIDEERVLLTRQGRLLSNTIFRELV